MGTKIHLVDGTYELFRAFFGARSARGPDGREVGATRSLLRSLLGLVTRDGATHVAVAFDHVIESFRNRLFDGYKTGDGIDPALLGQFTLAERAADALGMVVWSMVELEADDALASGAARFRDQVEQVVICSPDKDLCQCVRTDRVVTWDRLRGKVYDDAGVREKFGVAPASIPDLLALVGDAADGIPGVPRWGRKSAATVLGHYGHLEAIPEDPGQWAVPVRGAASLAASLSEHRDDALLYRRLATLREDAAVGALEALEWRGAERETLTALCDELGDQRFLDRIPRWRS